MGLYGRQWDFTPRRHKISPNFGRNPVVSGQGAKNPKNYVNSAKKARWSISRVLYAPYGGGDHSSGMPVTRHLVQPTRATIRKQIMCCPYLVLLPTGFTLPLLLPAARCALTAPFHPYLCSRTNHRRSSLCCTGRRLSPPRCYLALYPVEPGLSSALHPIERKRSMETSAQRLSGQLAARIA